MEVRTKRFLVFSFSIFALLSSNLHFLYALDQRPQRIVSINLCADELLLRVADPTQIAGVTRFEKSPDVSRTLQLNPQIKLLRGHTEEVLSLHPDLVLAGRFTDLNTRLMLERFHVPLLVLDIPQNFEQIYQNLEKVGNVVGHPNQSQKLIEQMKGRLKDLRESKKQDAKKTVRMIFFQRGGHVPGGNTFEDAILQQAEVSNIAADLGVKGYGMLSVEDLVLQKPDFILFPGDQNENPSVEKEMIHHPAIKKGIPNVQVMNIPSYMLNCGSPSSVDAVQMIRDQHEA